MNIIIKDRIQKGLEYEKVTYSRLAKTIYRRTWRI